MVDKNNRRKYAKEQFDLGQIYNEQSSLAKAIKHWGGSKRRGLR